jgi:hypothetical protein
LGEIDGPVIDFSGSNRQAAGAGFFPGDSFRLSIFPDRNLLRRSLPGKFYIPIHHVPGGPKKAAGRPTSARKGKDSPMINADVLKKFSSIVGPERLKTSKEDLLTYAYDAYVQEFLPDAVLFPKSPEEVSQIMKVAGALS